MSYIDRVVLSTFNGIYLVAGAFGVFKKSVVQELGGYRHDSLAEDLELTLRIHRHFIERGERYRISHVPNAVCWTEAPYNWSQLLRQRIRWQGGFVKTIIENRDMIFNTKYGLLGCVILPIHTLMIAEIFFLMIAISGIVIAAQNYSTESVLLAAIVAHCIANLIYVVSVLVGESHLKEHHYMQSFGRLVIWFFFGRIYDLVCLSFRLIGTFSQFRGQLTWGEMKRAGFKKS
jgi:cellulose synthase/poly-beta-1,6-N-acetylglucosamine synthase-like glycosyltransferase